MCQKTIFGILVLVLMKMVNIQGSIIDDETIEAKKTIPTKTISINNIFILLAFLLITISLLVIVSIYSHFIKIN